MCFRASAVDAVAPGFAETLRKKSRSHVSNVVVSEHMADAKHIKVDGRDEPLLNLASTDFLGFGSHPEVKKTAEDVLDVYTVGSCGPRGFYGTMDQHLLVRRYSSVDDHAAWLCWAIPNKQVVESELIM